MKPIYSTTEEHTPDFHKGTDKMQHYRVPEGYMEGLSERIMARISESHVQTIREEKISWWTKAKPSLYLAASFVGLFLCFKGVMLVQERTRGTEASQEMIASDDAYVRYYEDYATRLEGNESERALGLEQYM